MQIAFKLDPVTVAKIKKSALIALVGLLTAVLPMLQQDILKYLADKPYLVALITSVGSWVYNALKEWSAGQQQ